MKPYPHNKDYWVTEDGRVWSTKGWGRFLKSYDNKRGYLTVGIHIDNKQSTMKIHKMVLNTYVGECPAGYQCRHLDGDSYNNNLDNLCWGSQEENTADRNNHFIRGKIKDVKSVRV